MDNPTPIGTKYDDKKPRWSLLPVGAVRSIIAVLEFGAAKYAVDGWKHVEEPERRYYDAAMRHIESWRMKETNDPESNLPHLAHAVCCLLFLMWFDDHAPVQPDDYADCGGISGIARRSLDEAAKLGPLPRKPGSADG